MNRPSIHKVAVHIVKNQVGTSWISPILNYLRNKALLDDRSEALRVKARAAMYALINDILYKRSFFSP